MMSRALIGGGLVVLLLIPVTVLALKATKPAMQVDTPQAAAPEPPSAVTAMAAIDAPYQDAVKKLNEKQIAELALLEKGSIERMGPNIQILQTGAALESCSQQGFLSLPEYGPKFVKYQGYIHGTQTKDIQDFIERGLASTPFIDPEIVKKHLVYARIVKIQETADDIKAKLAVMPTPKEDCDKAKADIDAAIEKNKL